MTRIKFMENVGKVATVTAVAMYVSYFPQIMNNLAHPGTGDWIQPLVAAINCTLWVAYGLFKEHRDIPVALANATGISLCSLNKPYATHNVQLIAATNGWIQSPVPG